MSTGGTNARHTNIHASYAPSSFLEHSDRKTSARDEAMVMARVKDRMAPRVPSDECSGGAAPALIILRNPSRTRARNVPVTPRAMRLLTREEIMAREEITRTEVLDSDSAAQRSGEPCTSFYLLVCLEARKMHAPYERR